MRPRRRTDHRTYQERPLLAPVGLALVLLFSASALSVIAATAPATDLTDLRLEELMTVEVTSVSSKKSQPVALIDSQKWSATFRGFSGRSADDLLVLIDGRTVYSPLVAGVFREVQALPLEGIDRIEVIRGPGGTLR